MNQHSNPKLFHLLHRTHQALFRASGKMLGEELGISTSQSAVLLYLKRADNATMGDLAQAVGLTITSASGLIDRMEQKQLVLRQRSKSDRRIIRLSLTRTGRQILSKAEPLIKAANAVMLEKIGSDANVEIFTRACAAMIDAADELYSRPKPGATKLKHQTNQDTPSERTSA